MLKANCVKECKYQCDTCKRGFITVSERYRNNNELLKDENNNLYCYEGRFLTLYDKICEKCGEKFQPNGVEKTQNEIIAIYKCPKCNRVFKMEAFNN